MVINTFPKIGRFEFFEISSIVFKIDDKIPDELARSKIRVIRQKECLKKILKKA